MTTPSLLQVFGVLFALLAAATALQAVLPRRAVTEEGKATLHNAMARTRSWWVMLGVLALALLLGKTATLILFAAISFFCLREFIAITPTARGDRLPLFFAFFCLVPLQYLLIACDWYGLYSILIPVYGVLLLPVLAVFSHSTEFFFSRCAKIQWGVIISVYCISHAPALLLLPPLEGASLGYDARLLVVYLLFVAQISDVFQYVCGKLWGKHKLAPSVSPSKTIEGLVYGGGLAAVAGGALSFLTPFSFVAALLLSLGIVAFGALGGLVLSAVKRDMGVKDWGNTIGGHGGFMDRMDSIAFSAPFFFHMIRYFYTS